MNAKDFLYNSTFKQFMELGYSDRDAGYVAADAVNRWRRRGGGIQGDQGCDCLGQKTVQGA